MNELAAFKDELVVYAKKMALHGYVAGRAGNLSCRIKGRDRVVITPSGMDYDELNAGEMCVLDFDLVPQDGICVPSVESGLHVAVYRSRPEVNAVMHTHQAFAAVLSLINCPIPSLFDEQAYYLGPSIEVVPYAPSGSTELVHNVESKLSNRGYAYILQNHGALCLGASLKEAFHNVQLLEKIAQVYLFARLSQEKIGRLPPEAVNYLLQKRRDDQGKK